MAKFAHLADIHLGAHRDPVLQILELDSFNRAIDRCIDVGVDFILISGDFFHLAIPDLGVVDGALRKLCQAKDSGIPIYMIYGSHDYTPNGTSIIDLLDTAKIITKISRWKIAGEKLKLDVFEDKKTGAKLTGMSARRTGLESKYYEILDREALEKVDGFKIFAFHSGITEFKPPSLSEMETIPASSLPRGFHYYAGGHIHERGEFSLPGYDHIVFPGPLFTGYGKDIEATARGVERGFYIVSFDDKVRGLEFVPIRPFDGAFLEYDATGKNSVDAARELSQQADGLEAARKVVVLKIRGELSGGKTSDIDFTGIRMGLLERGALYVYVNRYGLASKEFATGKVLSEDVNAIEQSLLVEGLPSVSTSQPKLKGEVGLHTAVELLRTLRQPQKGEESKAEYAKRMVADGVTVLGVDELVGGSSE